jgi:fructokinase
MMRLPCLKNPLREKALWENLRTATIIKGSDEDFHVIFGRQSPEDHLHALQKINPDALIFITMGDQGAMACHHEKQILKKAEKTKVVSTIGAGDGFNAGIIAEIVRSGISPLALPDHMEKLLESGIRYSAAVCRSKDNYIPLSKP